MKIKTKLTLGVGLLFIFIVLLIVVGTYYINSLRSDTEQILVANYNTIVYSQKMLSALDEFTPEAIDTFESNLRLQENNITEIGEKEITQELRNYFNQYKKDTGDSAVVKSVRRMIYNITNINMEAIQRKSKIAEKTAEAANMWIALTGGVCFMIAFILLINLPSNIANPIKELTNSIKQIADKKYSERVHFEGHNEFGDLAKSFNTMAKKLEEYNNSNLAKLMMEKKRIDTLINKMHDPVIGLDEQLKVIFANEEALKTIGQPETEVIGRLMKDLAVHNDLIRSLVQDLLPSETPDNKKQQPIKIYADEKESYFIKETVNISIVPTGEQISTLIGYVIILRNVTEFKELDFAKTSFIATVSHEFKTPISSIKLSLQLLQNEQTGSLNADQKNLLTSINEDSDRLLKITSELLNMSQVESGQIQLSIVPSDPMEILNDAMNANKIQAEQKKIRFELTKPEQKLKVQADSDKTVWVLTNLISNAIRYSYENSIVYLGINEENGHIKFWIKDTGQGIAPQYKNKVFDRYFRIPGTKKEGTGLGLAISKEFIEAQGGQITVESDYGAGSVFTVFLKSVN